MPWLVCAGLAAVIVVAAIGCGGKSDTPPPAAQTPPPGMPPGGMSPGAMPPGAMPPGGAPPAGAPPAGAPAPGASPTSAAPGAAGPQTAQSGPAGSKPAGAKDDAKKKEEAKKLQKPLPANIAEWKPEDYLRARREADPRLKDAVKLLGQQNAGAANADEADKAAALLSRLLKPDEFQPPSPKPSAVPGKDAPPGPAGAPPAGPGAPPGAGTPPGSPPGAPGAAAPPSQSTSVVDSSASSATADLVVSLSSMTEDAESVTVSQNPPPAGAAPPGPAGAAPGAPGMPGQPGMPEQPGMPGQPAQGPGYRPLDAQTIRAIVQALAEIGSRSAQQQLAALIAGKLKTDDDRMATETALECLVTHPRPEYETMLFILLTAPEKVRPPEKASPPQAGGTAPQPGAEPAAPPQGVPGAPGSTPSGGKMTAEELQKKALALVEVTASAPFRLKLAGYLAEPSTPESQRALLGKFLLEERPENVAAQVAIYGSPMANAQTKTALEAYFARFSSYALARVFGIPPEQISTGQPAPGGAPPGQPGPGAVPPGLGQPAAPGAAAPGAAAPGMPPAGMPPAGPEAMSSPTPGLPASSALAAMGKKPSDPNLPYEIARLLWSPKFADPLQKRLQTAESLDKAAQEIAWASTIPTVPVRDTLYAALHKYEGKGAKEFLATGVLDRVVSDPGFVILVKTMPRKDAATARSESGRAGGESSRATKGGGLFPERMEKLRKAKQERDQAESEWMKASEDAVRALCRRLFAAAKARTRSGGDAEPAEQDAAAKSLPIELPKGATITAEYHLTWPDPPAKQKLGDIPLEPIRLHYVRIETESRPTSVVGVFKRRVSQPMIHQTELGPWVESFRPVPKTNRKLSIDVLVSRAKDLAAKASAASAGGPPPGQPPAGPPEAGAPGAPGEKPAAKGAAKGAAAEEPVDLVVEILTLETRDPTPEPEEKDK